MRWGLVVLLALAAGLVACKTIYSEAGPAQSYGDGPHGQERFRTGVVNGLWQCEARQNERRLLEHPKLLGDVDAVAMRARCQVRVGYEHGYDAAIPLLGMKPSASSEFVLLPEGWKTSLSTVVNDGATLNVGDIVEVRTRQGRIADWFVRLVRKCNDPPAQGEPLDLKIGCKSYVIYNERGYAGEKYTFSNF